MAEQGQDSRSQKSKDQGDTMEEEDGGESGDDIYEVEKIVGMQKRESKTLYRVRWVGYGPAGDTWEPLENLETCKDMIDAYLEKCTKKKERRQSKESLTSDIMSPEEGSTSSDKNEPEKNRQRKPTYYYVTSDDDKADTLKDKFWRDLEQGKINVFTGDMYSKVKGQGRASRPTSFCNTSNDDSERETIAQKDDTKTSAPVKKPKKVKKVERVKNGAMKRRRRKDSTTSESSQSTIPLKMSMKPSSPANKGKGKRLRGTSVQQTQKKPRLETSSNTVEEGNDEEDGDDEDDDHSAEVVESAGAKEECPSEAGSEISSSVTIGAGSVSIDSNSVIGSVVVKDEPPESVGSYPDTIQQLNDLDVKAELDALDETDYTTNIKEIPCDPVAMETNYSDSDSPSTMLHRTRTNVKGSNGFCDFKPDPSQKLLTNDPKLRSCVVVMKAISSVPSTEHKRVLSSEDEISSSPASPDSHVIDDSDPVIPNIDSVTRETEDIDTVNVTHSPNIMDITDMKNTQDKQVDDGQQFVNSTSGSPHSGTKNLLMNGALIAVAGEIACSRADVEDKIDKSELLPSDESDASTGQVSVREGESPGETSAVGSPTHSSVGLPSATDCDSLHKDGSETVANASVVNLDASICDNNSWTTDETSKNAINKPPQDIKTTFAGSLQSSDAKISNIKFNKSNTSSHAGRTSDVGHAQDSPVEVHFETSYELSDISDVDASPAGMVTDKSNSSCSHSNIRTADLPTMSPAQQLITVSADECENEIFSDLAVDKVHPSGSQTQQQRIPALEDQCVQSKVDSNQNLQDVTLNSSCSLNKCGVTTTMNVAPPTNYAYLVGNNRTYSDCAQVNSCYQKTHIDKSTLIPPSQIGHSPVMRTNQTIANVAMTTNDCRQLPGISTQDSYSLMTGGSMNTYPSYVHTTAPPSYTASVPTFTTTPPAGLHSGNSVFAPPPPTMSSMNIVESHQNHLTLQQTGMFPQNNHCLKTDTCMSDPRTAHDIHATSQTSCQAAGFMPKDAISNMPVAMTSSHTKGCTRDDAIFGFDLEDVDPVAWERKIPTHLAQSNCDIVELTNVELRQAVRENSYNRVRQALAGRRKYDLEQPDGAGMTLIVLAAYAGFDDMLELLTVHGANINARQKNGATALIRACEQGHRCTVELLLAMGAHVNVQQSNGETALMKAVKEGNKHIVQRLLEYGANFAMQSTSENTALKYAKLLNRSQALEMLKNHIARVTADFESQVYITLNNTARIKCALFPVQCFAINESDRHMVTFNHDLQPTQPGVGMLLFMAHAKFTLSETKCRFYGPCAVTNALLNGVPLHPLTEEANFVMSFIPLHHGRNVLEIHTVRAPKSRAKLVVCAYKAQLTMPPD